MLSNIVNTLCGSQNARKIKGTVVLMKKQGLDFNVLHTSASARENELLGNRVSLRLISSVNGDPANEHRGKLGKPAYLEDKVTTTIPIKAEEAAYGVSFDWDEEVGVPGALTIRNNHHTEFYLKTVTLEDVLGDDRILFICNSWVYPAGKYNRTRIFFSNKTYLPSDTPVALRKYREEELLSLRGDGKRKLKEWDRIYDYDYYNDLGNPDEDHMYARPVLGGSSEYPYPRRGRTGRPPSRTDPNMESRLDVIKGFDIYVPRDEQISHLRMSDVLAYAQKSFGGILNPELKSLCDIPPSEFNSFQDVLELYEGRLKVSEGSHRTLIDDIPAETPKEFLPIDVEGLIKFPMPQVIEEDKSAWRTDEEFAREMLAGVNPLIISRLQGFPPESKLDPEAYGNQASVITEEHIKNNLDGLTMHEAIENNRLFILDHHDALMPYLRRINSTSTKTYASRTLLFLNNDGTLKPLAIELSLPHPDGDEFGAISKVYAPSEQGVEGSIWKLAKAYVAVNDSGIHELISHWLHTHAVIEPFVIATYRQLSILHPIYKLLCPHFRDTMHMNAFARQILINAGGILEFTIFPGKYSMEMSSELYKKWVFPDQALPADLIKRGVAVKDPDSPHGLRLLIEDYPYAVDGLEIWSAIKTWVEYYCSYYYEIDDNIQKDSELQSWWKELIEEGHGDKKNEPWWPKMQTLEELVETCTIIIWVASALHAATNFGQYPYAGFHPNRPKRSRRFMPEKDTPEYEELKSDPEKVILRTMTTPLQTLVGISLTEILSTHFSDEVYLGQRDILEWTSDTKPFEAFKRFGKKLAEIEDRITSMNNDQKLKNRVGPVKVPYTLLYPTSESGITGKGIPNSITI